LVPVFVQKCQISPPIFLSFNLVMISDDVCGPFSLNFLKWINNFSSKLKLLIMMTCFIDVIKILIVSILIKNH